MNSREQNNRIFADAIAREQRLRDDVRMLQFYNHIDPEWSMGRTMGKTVFWILAIAFVIAFLI